MVCKTPPLDTTGEGVDRHNEFSEDASLVGCAPWSTHLKKTDEKKLTKKKLRFFGCKTCTKGKGSSEQWSTPMEGSVGREGRPALCVVVHSLGGERELHDRRDTWSTDV